MSLRSYPGEPALVQPPPSWRGLAKRVLEGDWVRPRYRWSRGRVALVLTSVNLDFGFNLELAKWPGKPMVRAKCPRIEDPLP